MTATTSPTRIGVNDVLRLVLELFAFVTLGIWGFVAFEFPLAIVVGIGAPAVAILLWALFRSPKAVFSIDVFGRSLVELLVVAAATLAWLDLGHPVVGLVYAAVAVISGVVAGRRELGR
ncbi:YrdB family protein [Labedella endophytica]|uniref:DUF2568 domain-containing protein n=1 Tax=Labedella endophytica TaxID=1523160 RepID=A0A3S0X921_9MICO|nr:YrdB family protein [Labedella endophytica]RUQ98962.1 DUF2568 domain-containing protein [Labedella endophytica]